ncbi:hypothetical protein O6P43_020042 [Quillaja saponaria]|uniref:Uncharacterized protein n=1 Tax=Quillaja saponaria TaxID=32244 RepID=A0AAD7PKW6_QUISA|nr:hypothetical protein O6P43_020042 [Quillaja saponaria]
MSSERGSPSAPPFELSDDHLANGTIVSVGEEPTYRPGKGKVLPPSLAYHPSKSSSSDNTESRSFKVEDEATSLSCFSPKGDKNEESDDDMAIFWPQTNIVVVNAIENIISDHKLEIASRRYFEPVGAKVYKVGPYENRPHHSCPNTFCFKVLNALEICPTQVVPNKWRFLITFINMGLTLEQEAAEVRASIEDASEDAYINNIPSAAFAIARGTTLPADVALMDQSFVGECLYYWAVGWRVGEVAWRGRCKEEDVKEEERLANMLTEAESATDEVLDEEGIADGEVET